MIFVFLLKNLAACVLSSSDLQKCFAGQILGRFGQAISPGGIFIFYSKYRNESVTGQIWAGTIKAWADLGRLGRFWAGNTSGLNFKYFAVNIKIKVFWADLAWADLSRLGRFLAGNTSGLN